MFNYRKHRATLPREIAERSAMHTMALLTTIADNMSPNELRGYIRAHALPCVLEEAWQLVSREWPTAAFNELVATATEQATHLVLRQMQSLPTVNVPTPHVRLRIAA
ncbi:MAG TPA: hypothetical protein VHU84_15010 [Lacipirellulaceae bacterium]|jgi:hypothetical protein|nr:hypothetical protein [Lacipirellulaceae bacterium]